MTGLLVAGGLLALLTLAWMTRPLWRGGAAGAPSRGLVAGLAVFIAAVAAAGYAWLGSPQALDPAARSAAAVPDHASGQITPAQIESMVELLQNRVKERPDDADGWAMLGRANALLDRHALAAPAFKRAMELRPQDAGLVADYADALAMVNGRSLDGEPARLIQRALEIDPLNQKALSLAGTVAFNRQDYAGAIVQWEKLAPLVDGDAAQQVRAGIDEARRLLSQAGPSAAAAPAGKTGAAPAAPVAPGAAPTAAAAPAAALRGTVTLSPALAAQAKPDDALFVFARPAEGSRMPLAILRKQVKDLPLDFVLDDSSAMSPAMRLSSAPRVVVGARISRAGDAAPRAGDLQGFSQPVAPGTSGLKIEIGELVR